jgi:hypothetical protein
MDTRHIIPISGKDSLWTAIIQKRRDSTLTYEYMFNDTRAELPETYEWLDKVEQYLNASIFKIGESLEDIMYDQGILPSPRARYCTRMSKIYPMEHWIGKSPAYVYYGIRADERERVGYVATNKKSKITPMYPLIDEDQKLYDVFEGLHAYNLLPPAFEWSALIDLVKRMLKEKDTLLTQLHPLTFRQLFAWRSRTNCYFCFFQRRYEWIGLAEHHPRLFERACELEEEIGAKGYTWIQGIRLKEYVKKRDTVMEKRAKAITKFILENEPILVEADEPVDLLQITSCGLFCGK